jgi:hypothetical protein
MTQRFLTAIGIAVLTFGVASPLLAPPQPVPEIDPSVAQNALTLFVGGVLVLLGRRRHD